MSISDFMKMSTSQLFSSAKIVDNDGQEIPPESLDGKIVGIYFSVSFILILIIILMLYALLYSSQSV